MAHVTGNYATEGGDKWVVGGNLDIVDDGQITKNGEPVDLGGGQDMSNYYTKTEADNTFQPKGSYAEASHTHASDVTQISDPASATAEDIANKINELLTALQG